MSELGLYWQWRLERVVWALSLEAQAQEALYPSYVCVADELVLELDECIEGSIAAGVSLDPKVKDALSELDQHVERMSGVHNLHLWNSEALRGAAEWRVVRELARAVRETASWTRGFSGSGAAIFVGEPEP